MKPVWQTYFFYVVTAHVYANFVTFSCKKLLTCLQYIKQNTKIGFKYMHELYSALTPVMQNTNWFLKCSDEPKYCIRNMWYKLKYNVTYLIVYWQHSIVGIEF